MRRLIFLNAIEQVNNDEVNDEVNDEGNDEVNVLHFYIFLGRSEIEYFFVNIVKLECLLSISNIDVQIIENFIN